MRCREALSFVWKDLMWSLLGRWGTVSPWRRTGGGRAEGGRGSIIALIREEKLLDVLKFVLQGLDPSLALGVGEGDDGRVARRSPLVSILSRASIRSFLLHHRLLFTFKQVWIELPR